MKLRSRGLTFAVIPLAGMANEASLSLIAQAKEANSDTSNQPTLAAPKSAAVWLGLVDFARYAESWKATATLYGSDERSKMALGDADSTSTAGNAGIEIVHERHLY